MEDVDDENYCRKNKITAVKRSSRNSCRSPIISGSDVIYDGDCIEHLSFKRSRIDSDYLGRPSDSRYNSSGLDMAVPPHSGHANDEVDNNKCVPLRTISGCFGSESDETFQAAIEPNPGESCVEDDKILPENQTTLVNRQSAENNEGEGNNEDDNDCDDVSEFSGLSDLSMESKWTSPADVLAWVHQQIIQGVNPRSVLHSMISDDTDIPDDLDDKTLWQLIVRIISEPPRRRRLEHIRTLEDVVRLLQTSRKIIVLTGAGVSVSCGIPDFRSRDGIYARLAADYPDLPDPQAMFDIQYFRKNPKPFFKFAKEIYPGQFAPSVSHRFIGCLESHDRLLRNYTQNIDTLESTAGITRVVQCHGSFAGATCMICKHRVDAEAVREDIMNQVIPRCPMCSRDEKLSILKPNIVFFGESLSDEFHQQIQQDKEECDLLIVIGSSLKVRPVAIIPSILPSHVPQVLINRESLKHLSFDVELLGDCDAIVNELCHRLGDVEWSSLCTTPTPAVQMAKGEAVTPPASADPQQSSSHGPFAFSPPVVDGDRPAVESVNGGVRSREGEVTMATGGGTVATTTVDDVTSLRKTEELPTAGTTKRTEKSKQIKLTSLLKDNSFLFIPPRRYVFVGAEVYDDDDGDDDISSSSSSSSENDDDDDGSFDEQFEDSRRREEEKEDGTGDDRPTAVEEDV